MESWLLLLQLFIRFDFSNDAMDAICRVVKAHCADDFECCSSFSELRDRFARSEKGGALFHVFCRYCHHLFDENELVCPLCYKARDESLFFVEFPIELEIKRRFEDPEFLKAIQYPFTREKKEGVIQDIQDGSEYKRFPLLEKFGNLSFTINTDGAAVFKNPSTQLWPVYLEINELPPNVR